MHKSSMVELSYPTLPCILIDEIYLVHHDTRLLPLHFLKPDQTFNESVMNITNVM